MRQLRWIALLVATLGLLACSRTVGRVPEPDAGVEAGQGGAPVEVRSSDKLDVLFVMDNTLTASFAHALLARTVPYLLDRLVHPRCTNGLGQVVSEPADPTAPCPVGRRDFAPLDDVHFAVISTSLGGHGADSCSPAAGSYHPEQDDQAHLLSRNAAGGEVSTYDDLGFLVWDPAQALSPPGQDDIEDLVSSLQTMMGGVGGRGCGYEAQLESMYRFLVDPDPYEQITVQDGAAIAEGTDEIVLQQRAAFLRPDSVLLVVLLTDENDCSTRDGGQYYLVNQTTAGSGIYHLPRARSECETDPSDPCCASCAQPTPAGCPSNSPACQLPPFDDIEDPVNLRCWDQKRRFGIDFLYPIERYVDGLSSPTVTDRHGELRENPLFAGGRSPELVVVAGLLGVPWQDIAYSSSNVESGYKPPTEINWGLLLPDPATQAPPTDPLMVESTQERSGVHPVTGDALEPSSAGSPTANPINGHEHQLSSELQYACTYRLPYALPCDQLDCVCVPSAIDSNPICQAPDGSYGTVQYYGRATPASRPLSLIRDLATHSVVASICAANVSSEQLPSFAYRPAVDAIIRSLHSRLEPFQAGTDAQ